MRYVLLCLLLAGCAITPEQRAERMVSRFGPVCDKLGFQPDSDAWRNCVLQQSGIAQSNAAAFNAAMQNRSRTCSTYGANTTCY